MRLSKNLLHSNAYNKQKDEWGTYVQTWYVKELGDRLNVERRMATERP